MSGDEASATKPSLSLADRITKPEPVPDKMDGEESAPVPDQAKPSSWADEVASPTVAKIEPMDEPKKSAEDKDKGMQSGSITEPQVDGASVARNGSDLQEPDYDVEVKLSDLRADPNNPLYSARSFEDIAGL